ncbi:metallo beta lactamase protein [Fusarium bulbicola]|nr:metallo beta lactamase protein [Fusarium bulbicola]
MSFTPEPYDPITADSWLVCDTCGTQFPTSDRSTLKTCHICDDPRQFVPPSGQSFSTLGELKKKHKNEWTKCPSDENITFISSQPKLAIGQRAILIKTPEGNVLWDCITLLDDETVERIESEGGLKAIVISHPHFYSTHVQWARAFNCPVYLAAEDKIWTTLSSTHQIFLTALETPIISTAKAIKLGGHFPGSMVLHYNSRLFIADTLMTTASGVGNWSVDATGSSRSRPAGLNSFSFLWSIPNFIPLGVGEMARMWGILKGYEFGATHGGFMGMDIESEDVKGRVLESMKIQAGFIGDKEFEEKL